MWIAQQYGEFSIYGNPQNDFSVVLAVDGPPPTDFAAKAYRGNTQAELSTLSPVITTTARPGHYRLTVTAAKMEQVATYSNLFVEIFFNGRVQFRGPYRADRLAGEPNPNDVIKLTSALGETMYVYAEVILGDMLNIQADVTAKRGEAVAARDVAVSARDEAVNAVGNILTLVSYDDVSAKVGIGGNVTVTDHSDDPTLPYVTVTFL